MGVSNSPLCRVAWTDVVQGTQHFAFQEADPVELRLGLKFDPSFWSSFDRSEFNLWFNVFHFGTLRTDYLQQGDTLSLPGARSTELWIGLSFDQAAQATDNRNGLFQFRPQIWFQRSDIDEATGIGSHVPGEFAAAPNDHTFVVELGGSGSGWPSGAPQLVGGSGHPDL
jgi:hypothetical protein